MIEGAQTFAVRSDAYAANRPRYPDALYAWIASQCRGHDRAWDCATGNGQAAVSLSPHFHSVSATDVSAEQIRHADPRPNIDYAVGSAEQTGYPTASFDLVTVAQALHWFDYAKFWREVERVAKPDSFFCA